MAFAMSQIKRKVACKQDYIKECHFVLKDLDILTDNVRFGLWQYADYRFKYRNRGILNGETFYRMIQELLEYCCGKSFNSISRQDVNINENQILYEIKKAIYYGATRCLYDVSNTVVTLDSSMFAKKVPEPKKLDSSRQLSSVEVKDYFKDLIVIC